MPRIPEVAGLVLRLTRHFHSGLGIERPKERGPAASSDNSFRKRIEVRARHGAYITM